jgi:hypothetical protein
MRAARVLVTAGRRCTASLLLAGTVAVPLHAQADTSGAGLDGAYPAMEAALAPTLSLDASALDGVLRRDAATAAEEGWGGGYLGELRTLRARLPVAVPLVVGGAVAAGLAAELADAGIRVGTTLAEPADVLRDARSVADRGADLDDRSHYRADDPAGSR